MWFKMNYWINGLIKCQYHTSETTEIDQYFNVQIYGLKRVSPLNFINSCCHFNSFNPDKCSKHAKRMLKILTWKAFRSKFAIVKIKLKAAAATEMVRGGIHSPANNKWSATKTKWKMNYRAFGFNLEQTKIHTNWNNRGV